MRPLVSMPLIAVAAIAVSLSQARFVRAQPAEVTELHYVQPLVSVIEGAPSG